MSLHVHADVDVDVDIEAICKYRVHVHGYADVYADVDADVRRCACVHVSERVVDVAVRVWPHATRQRTPMRLLIVISQV